MSITPADLQGFGLSSYEARVYIALISCGTISASEVSYHSGVPRPKVYPVLRRLEKRSLAVLSGSKPVMCTAVSPSQAFDGTVQDHTRRAESMGSLVGKLERLSRESGRAGGARELRLVHVESGGVMAQVQAAIEGASESLYIIAGRRLPEMLSGCRQQLIMAARRSVDARLIIPAELIDSELIRYVPQGVQVRIGYATRDCIVADGASVLALDSQGRAAVIESSEILAGVQAGLFLQIWEASQRTDGLADMSSDEAGEAYRIVRLVGGGALGHLLSSSISSDHNIIEFLEDNGVRLRAKSWDQLIDTIDAILQMTCGGRVEARGDHVTVESQTNSGHSLPWAAILDEYLQASGRQTRIIYQNRARDGERVHIKIR